MLLSDVKNRQTVIAVKDELTKQYESEMISEEDYNEKVSQLEDRFSFL